MHADKKYTTNWQTNKGVKIKSNQIKFIKRRKTKLVTNIAITVTQHDTMKQNEPVLLEEKIKNLKKKHNYKNHMLNSKL